MAGKRTKLPKREVGIGARLKWFREQLRLTQSEFAKQVGIKRERLASYEEGRAPLRYDLALRICRRYVIGEKWLATGEGYLRQYLDMQSERIPPTWPLDAPFSETYDKVLSPVFESLAKTHAYRIDFSDTEPIDALQDAFGYLIYQWTAHLATEADRRALVLLLLEVGFGFTEYSIKVGRVPSLKELALYSVGGASERPSFAGLKK